MTELNELPIKSLIKFYSVETIKDLKEVLLEEETEDVDGIDLVAIDVLRASGF